MLLSVLTSHAALETENSELRHKLRRAEEARDHLARELADRTQTSERLAGVLAHDLRNPLGAILAGVDLLKRRGGLGELQANILGRIHSSGQHAAHLIEELLDFTQARLGGGLKIHRAPTDMTAIARQVIDETEPAYPGRCIRLETEGDVDGDWDEERLAQIFSNLLANALAHSPEDAAITVRTWTRDGEAFTSVHNGGPAIDEEAMGQLFEPFRRGEKRTARSGKHLGLGLYIVQQIVRAHGGRVEVRSTENEGTTFLVSLPRADELVSAPKPHMESSMGGTEEAATERY
ncbi:sensor histidine kinase [Pendulispora albinea]|uniref:histidine kinase n=1 Tax=Pendulispora albinea TaxID=2741071 RepID=A0ABZ2MCN2_9BACT